MGVMLAYVTHWEWQLLRSLLRAESAGKPPPLGSEVRTHHTRKTRDGTFLDRLIDEGLLEVAKEAPPAAARARTGEKLAPMQFRRRYRLTAVGRHAAEYGEYDRPYSPKPAPLSGAAAKLFGGGRAGKKATRKTKPAGK